MKAPRKVLLEELRAGARFQFHGRRGRLVRLTSGAAEVNIERPAAREFVTRGGQRVSIRRLTEHTTWSRQTVVEVLRPILDPAITHTEGTDR